jgi:hypothetical protein
MLNPTFGVMEFPNVSGVKAGGEVLKSNFTLLPKTQLYASF